MSSTEFTGIRFTRMCGAAVTLRRNPGSDTGGFSRHVLARRPWGRADPFKRKFHFLSSSHWELRFERTARARAFASKIRGSANRKHGGMDPAFLPFYLCGVSIRRGRVCFRFVAALALA